MHTLETLGPSLMNTSVDPEKCDTWNTWSVDGVAVNAARSKCRVDMRFGGP